MPIRAQDYGRSADVVPRETEGLTVQPSGIEAGDQNTQLLAC